AAIQEHVKETVRHLRALEPEEYEIRRRAEAKRLNIRERALDELVGNDATDATEGRESQADILIKLARDRAKLFHDGDTAHAILKVESHHEVWPLQSKSFRDWLFKIYFEEKGKAPNAEAVRAAINTLAGFARFGSNDHPAPEHKASVRLAEAGGKIYLDLADEHWRAVEIDADGWQLIDDPAAHGIYFRR